MDDIVILEHVKVSELPTEWMEHIKTKTNKTFTVTIVPEKRISRSKTVKVIKPNQTFGMWSDRDDLDDAANYVRKFRQARY